MLRHLSLTSVTAIEATDPRFFVLSFFEVIFLKVFLPKFQCFLYHILKPQIGPIF